MLILLSPAKTLDLVSPFPDQPSDACFAAAGRRGMTAGAGSALAPLTAASVSPTGV